MQIIQKFFLIFIFFLILLGNIPITEANKQELQSKYLVFWYTQFLFNEQNPEKKIKLANPIIILNFFKVDSKGNFFERKELGFHIKKKSKKNEKSIIGGGADHESFYKLLFDASVKDKKTLNTLQKIFNSGSKKKINISSYLLRSFWKNLFQYLNRSKDYSDLKNNFNLQVSPVLEPPNKNFQKNLLSENKKNINWSNIQFPRELLEKNSPEFKKLIEAAKERENTHKEPEPVQPKEIESQVNDNNTSPLLEQPKAEVPLNKVKNSKPSNKILIFTLIVLIILLCFALFLVFKLRKRNNSLKFKINGIFLNLNYSSKGHDQQEMRKNVEEDKTYDEKYDLIIFELKRLKNLANTSNYQEFIDEVKNQLQFSNYSYTQWVDSFSDHDPAKTVARILGQRILNLQNEVDNFKSTESKITEEINVLLNSSEPEFSISFQHLLDSHKELNKELGSKDKSFQTEKEQLNIEIDKLLKENKVLENFACFINKTQSPYKIEKGLPKSDSPNSQSPLELNKSNSIITKKMKQIVSILKEWEKQRLFPMALPSAEIREDFIFDGIQTGEYLTDIQNSLKENLKIVKSRYKQLGISPLDLDCHSSKEESVFSEIKENIRRLNTIVKYLAEHDTILTDLSSTQKKINKFYEKIICLDYDSEEIFVDGNFNELKFKHWTFEQLDPILRQPYRGLLILFQRYCYFYPKVDSKMESFRKESRKNIKYGNTPEIRTLIRLAKAEAVKIAEMLGITYHEIEIFETAFNNESHKLDGGNNIHEYQEEWVQFLRSQIQEGKEDLFENRIIGIQSFGFQSRLDEIADEKSVVQIFQKAYKENLLGTK